MNSTIQEAGWIRWKLCQMASRVPKTISIKYYLTAEILDNSFICSLYLATGRRMGKSWFPKRAVPSVSATHLFFKLTLSYFFSPSGIHHSPFPGWAIAWWVCCSVPIMRYTELFILKSEVSQKMKYHWHKYWQPAFHEGMWSKADNHYGPFRYFCRECR